ncbi:MAG: protein kinase [Dehalococcoidia bacterium]|nr:protein kinase [Dehalococcoidia bacterium]
MSRFTSDRPSRISHFDVGELLGRGGMGAVYRATDPWSGKEVAIKLLHAHLTDDAAFRERFVREAHFASLLSSPYTCKLLEYGEEADLHFMVMELVEGQTVRQLVGDGPLPPARALDLARQAALSLEEAESKGLVHRDIKPENLKVTPEGRLKVLDFGIARRLEGGTITQTGQYLGTAAYSAPEAFSDSRKIDHRSDIYSLGATLFYMLSGEPPFKGDSALSLIRQHEQEPPPLEKLSGQGASVIEIVRRCLEKDQDHRYQNVSELVRALEEARGSLPLAPTGTIVARPPASAPSVVTRPAAPVAISVELMPARSAGRWGASYVMTLENTGAGDATVALAASDAGGGCRFDLPAETTVPAGRQRDVTVRVSPGRRRWRGPRRERSFQVTASDGGGGPPATVSGQFEEVPFFSGRVGWASLGGAVLGGGAGLAIILALLLGGGGDGLTLEEYFAELERLAQAYEEADDAQRLMNIMKFNEAESDEELTTAILEAFGPLRSLQQAFIVDVSELEPPVEVEDAHQAFLDALRVQADAAAHLNALLEEGFPEVEAERVEFGGAFDVFPIPTAYAVTDACSALQQMADEEQISVDLRCAHQLNPSKSAFGPGLIVFSSDREADFAGDSDIYVMSGDGSAVTPLTSGAGVDVTPAWSPDGRRIAFVSDRGGSFDIYVMNADGSDQRALTADPALDAQPAWSPDGARIAFTSTRGGDTDIYVMNADGSGQTVLTEDGADPAGDIDPVWSPDGTRIAFASDRDGDLDIYAMNADGLGVTLLTDDADEPAGDSAPVWSPGGTKIAFSSDRDGDLDIYEMNPDGSGVTLLTDDADDPAEDTDPAYVPEGRRLAFASDRDGDLEIYMIRIVRPEDRPYGDDATSPIRLTDHRADDSAPDWSVAP